MWKFAKPFLYFRVLFSATAALFDWMKLVVWNQVVLVSCSSRATVEPAYQGSSTKFETGLSYLFLSTLQKKKSEICMNVLLWILVTTQSSENEQLPPCTVHKESKLL